MNNFTQFSKISRIQRPNCQILHPFLHHHHHHHQYPPRVIYTRFLTSTSQPTKLPLRDRLLQHKTFGKYLTQFQSQPTSYFISFFILHEITAIVPIPLFYLTFQYLDVTLPFLSDTTNPTRVLKILQYFGIHSGEESINTESIETAKMILYATAAYGVVKLLLPVRVALSVYWTPWMAKWVVGPVGRVGKRIVGSVKKRKDN
jgi:hypothetical protein